MNKSIFWKLFIILILVIIIYISFGAKSSYAYGEIFDEGKNFLIEGQRESKLKTEELKKTSDYIYNALLGFAIMLAVIIAMVLGIQFMFASADEKAKVKEALMPFIVGCVVVFGSFTIWRIVINVGNKAGGAVLDLFPYCYGCGEANLSGSVNCKNCGYAMETWQSKEEIDRYAEFNYCPYCGNDKFYISAKYILCKNEECPHKIWAYDTADEVRVRNAISDAEKFIGAQNVEIKSKDYDTTSGVIGGQTIIVLPDKTVQEQNFIKVFDDWARDICEYGINADTCARYNGMIPTFTYCPYKECFEKYDDFGKIDKNTRKCENCEKPGSYILESDIEKVEICPHCGMYGKCSISSHYWFCRHCKARFYTKNGFSDDKVKEKFEYYKNWGDYDLYNVPWVLLKEWHEAGLITEEELEEGY